MKSIKWTTVRGFGKVKYFNISYVILLVLPILFELHKKAAEASEFFKNTVDFPPTLRWLYAASFLYAIGIAIYQYFCPPVIKRFGNVDEYLTDFHQLFLRSHPHHRLNVVLTHLEPDIDSGIKNKIDQLTAKIDSTDGTDKIETQKELDTVIESLHADAVQRFLTKDYEAKNEGSPPALWASFILYVLGTLILLTLLILKSLYVIF